MSNNELRQGFRDGRREGEFDADNQLPYHDLGYADDDYNDGYAEGYADGYSAAETRAGRSSTDSSVSNNEYSESWPGAQIGQKLD